MAEYGFVYCLSNQCMPGVYKIGFTRGSPHFRAEQLSAPTGIPTPFEVEWYVESDDPERMEKALHDSLRKYRISINREFFKICPIHVFELMDRDYLSDWMSADYLFRLEQRKTTKMLVS